MNKKGVLLLSTLFFIVVLIMMSIALFGLTQNNYKVNKDYFADQNSLNNAENTIQILIFLIQQDPNVFKLNNNSINFPTPKIDKILSNNDFNQNLPYFYIVYNMRDGIVKTNCTSAPTISRDEVSSNGIYALIFYPKNKPISEEGVVFFFGNKIDPNNVLNKDNGNIAYYEIINPTSVKFYINTLPPNNSVSFPIYSSLNNGGTDVEMNRLSPNSSRKISKYSVNLFALSYSRVPGQNRYKVNYLEQEFLRTSMIQANVLNNGTTNVEAKNLNLIADNYKLNSFISNKYQTMYLNDTQGQTRFNLTNSQSTIKGRLVVKDTSSGNLYFNGNTYNFQQILNDTTLTQNVQNTIGGKIEKTEKNYDTQKIRDAIVNKIQQQAANYVSLPAGWYVFTDEKTIVYFPPSYTYDQIKNNINSVNQTVTNLSGLLNTTNPVKIQNKIEDNGKQILKIDNYTLNVNTNIKVENNFIHITSYGVYQGVNKFGNKDVKINLNNANFFGNNAALIVDGPIKGQGALIVTGNGTLSNTHQAVDYYNNPTYWTPYDTTNLNYTVNSGDIVARFDQLRSGDSQVAILADNNFIINPLSIQDDTSFFDRLITYQMIAYAKSIGNNTIAASVKGNPPSQIDKSEIDKSELFQVILDKPDSIDPLIGKSNEFKSKFDNWQNYTITITTNGYSNSSVYNNVMSSRSFGTNKITSIPRDPDLSKTITIDPTNGIIKVNSQVIQSPLFNAFSSPITFDNADFVAYTVGNVGILVVGTTSGSPTLYFYAFEKNGSTWTKTFEKTVTKNIDVKKILGYLDNIDGIEATDYLTLEKLALGLAAAEKNDGNFLEPWKNGLNNVTTQDLHSKSQDILKDRIQGLYTEYNKILKQQSLTSKAGDPNDVAKGDINDNYFPFLKLSINAGKKVGSPLSYGFSNLLRDNPTEISSLLSTPNDVKLEGFIWVGNQLKAVTGSNNNLLFKGSTVVGKNEGALLGIKGVRNTTFVFDMDIVNLLENMEAPSLTLPTVYRIYNKIYTR